MGITIPRSLVEFILLGPEDDRRQLQDSPILGDVWVEFARNPGSKVELLITPHKEQAAGLVAARLSKCKGVVRPHIAFLQGIVAASLSFKEVLRCVVPMTWWWKNERVSNAIEAYKSDSALIRSDIAQLLEAASAWRKKESIRPMQDVEAGERYIALAGLLLWADSQPDNPSWNDLKSDDQITAILTTANLPELISLSLKEMFKDLENHSGEAAGFIWTISLNRRAAPALTKSVPAVKADAARTLFMVNCKEIVWAVIDSGIDASHTAFHDNAGDGKSSRVTKAFDFTKIREIVSLDNALDDAGRAERAKKIFDRGLKDLELDVQAVDALLKTLAEDAQEGRPVDWLRVQRLVEISPKTRPPSNHGTHVAGIIGGAKKRDGSDHKDAADGMCPDIRIYDFRVLAPTLSETEFAIVAALQYIRHVNERNSYTTIHGANLSLSIAHDVRNYACGRTPVCVECERLVNSGVVVVAAAGNRGYQNFETKDGLYEGYAAFSITDPGNADGVITVGATHRSWPHTYGVSFFSSRGPTGDGRLKPDLVAPGERIRGPLLGGAWGDLDGTSMSAPHVSGAAAMLMARYTELVGQPRRIKEILCNSATDLGRERTFQGHGMLDVLRAFQSV
jgi:serine protease AprX